MNKAMNEAEQRLFVQFEHARNLFDDNLHNYVVKCDVTEAGFMSPDRFKEIAKSVFPEDEFTYEWPDFFATFVPIVVFKKR